MAAASLATGAHHELPASATSVKVEVQYSLKAHDGGHGPNIWVVPYNCDGEESDGCRFFSTAVQQSNLNRNMKYTPLEFNDQGPRGGTVEIQITPLAEVTYIYLTGKENLANVNDITCRVFAVNGAGGDVVTTHVPGADVATAGSVVLLALYMKNPAMYRGEALKMAFHAKNLTLPLTRGWEVARELYRTTKETYPSAFPADYVKLTGTLEEIAHVQSHMIHGSHVTVGISWNRGDSNLDLDLTCVLGSAFHHVKDVVYFNHPVDERGFVRHLGDTRVGQSEYRYVAGNGDDEQIVIDLDRVKTQPGRIGDITAFSFIVTAYNGYITNDTECVVTVTEGNNGAGKERIRWRLKNLPDQVESVFLLEINSKSISAEGNTRYEYFEESLRGADLTGNIPQAILFAVNQFSGFVHTDEPVPLQTRGIRWIDDVNRKDFKAKCPSQSGPVDRPAAGARPALQAVAALPATQPVDVAAQQKLSILAHIGLDLRSADMNGASDPYIEFSLASGKGKKIKTKVIDKTLNPGWEQHLSFAGPFTADDSLKMDVFDKDLIGQDFLGTVSVKLADIWRMKGPQMLKLTGADKAGHEAEGFIFVSFDWQDLQAMPGRQPKLNA